MGGSTRPIRTTSAPTCSATSSAIDGSGCTSRRSPRSTGPKMLSPAPARRARVERLPTSTASPAISGDPMPQASDTKTSVLDRFLRYVTVDTQSAENSTTYPSTAKQLVLLDQLAEELRTMGLKDAVRDSHGYVMATVPATSKKNNVPVIGFVAHVDTSPEASGAGVKPIVHRDWNGQDIVLPDDPTAVLRISEIPILKEQIGNDIVTASGT